jgi:hypothetical protein
MIELASVINWGTNLHECEDHSWLKVQAVPVFEFDCCNMSSRTLSLPNSMGCPDPCEYQEPIGADPGVPGVQMCNGRMCVLLQADGGAPGAGNTACRG